NPELEKQWGGHAGISQVMARDSKFGKLIPEIVGQHHGYSPSVAGRCSQDQVFGGEAWHKRREELVVALQKSLDCEWPIIESALQARVISGLTTVSDWVGSGQFFEDPQAEWQPNIKMALDDAGFIQPKLQEGLSFKEIFSFSAHDAQKKLFEHCIQPGVYILEAPMGLGKTEAALYAAYLAMAADKAKGFYFALPTQLTSDKIHVRVNNFLQKILAPDCRHRQALLLHGNAWLNASEMGEDGKPGGSWFNSSKRGILAPFAVGTIDQALMAVMNVKHGFVRTFGLAGKVVILDEVHSYDAYTGTILDKLVSALRELHCTVIILSATLTKDRRQSFLQQEPASNDYPLISVFPNGEKLNEVMVEPITDMQVTIHHCQQDSDALDEVLLRAEQGQQVLWIENTVAEAQDRYKLLADRAKSLGVAVGLLHSRYTKEDRDFNEQRWVRLYGKDGAEERQQQGRILVGTQVLEQSLDIDADFLVTRICPTDMLLQRIGRLWRHSETVRHSEALREAWLLEPLLAEAFEDAKKVFGKTAKVYSPYVLCRSLEIWSALSCVVIPGQIRELLEATYVERAEAEQMARHKEEMAKEIEKLGRLALVGLSQGGKTLPEHKASTRYNEQETVDVLLIRSYRPSSDKLGTNVVLLSGESLFLPRNCKAQNRQRWRELAEILQKNIVKVATYQAPDDV
ncbi:MAG TPA: CRISPR-associated helicase Cas3', partial [Pseudomonadales bacterium]|nr:CRISPR-associated helicase Cas3' [Pseudomonadales bacterium]